MMTLLKLAGACITLFPVAGGFQISPETDLALYGPIYQTAPNSSFQAFAEAKIQAKATIEEVIANGNSTYGLFDNLTTSFSLSVFRLADEEPLFEYHFEAPELSESLTKGKLTEDTIYRAGSIGKLMTVYTFLIDIGDGLNNEHVTRYIVSTVRWSYGNERRY